MAGEEPDNSDTYADPNHPGHQLPRPSALVRGQGSLQSLGLDGGAGGPGGLLGGMGGIGEMLQGFLQAIMQLFHIGGSGLDAHDQQRTQIDKNSNLSNATATVRQNAATDPQAKTLLDNYNTTSVGVQTAFAGAQKTPNAAAYLALESAEMNRSMVRADMVKYDAAQRGDDKLAGSADQWKQTAQGVKDALSEIQKLPPAQQQQAMDKFAQDNPNSRLAQEWKTFEAGDLSKWKASNSNDGPGASTGRTASATSQYDLPGDGITGADKTGLQAAFKSAASGVPAVAPQQPAPQGPVVVTQRNNNTQTFNV